jgi:tRNA dimethylallyltransferase|tara:strand:+ start:1593 stop:2507 length:915 start_codon:yes stop_codon:yes gene_type:complete
LNQTLYFIVGPTAIGKSSLALRLAEKINGVIINADSMQVYSNLKILTARPSSADLKRISHQLYGYVDGSIRYNVSKWCNDILKVIQKNQINNTPLIIVGGTGMYIDKLLNGLIDIPSIPELIKEKSENLVKKVGLGNFLKIVNDIDPVSLNNISANDTNRLKRIWEVYSFTGIPFSEWKKKQNNFFLNKPDYHIYLFTPSREKIYERVNMRFKKMLNQGAIEEVRQLILLKLDKSLPIMRAHGVPEITDYLSNVSTLDDCISRGQQITRNYVKRQLTWWRSCSLRIHQSFDEFPEKIDEKLLKI